MKQIQLVLHNFKVLPGRIKTIIQLILGRMRQPEIACIKAPSPKNTWVKYLLPILQCAPLLFRRP
jgi:hypothetical protein